MISRVASTRSWVPSTSLIMYSISSVLTAETKWLMLPSTEEGGLPFARRFSRSWGRVQQKGVSSLLRGRGASKRESCIKGCSEHSREGADG